MSRPPDTTTPAPPAAEFVLRVSGLSVPAHAGASALDPASVPATASTPAAGLGENAAPSLGSGPLACLRRHAVALGSILSALTLLVAVATIAYSNHHADVAHQDAQQTHRDNQLAHED